MKRIADTPVVILAGGMGTRLKPYTTVLPKPLVPVGQYPILEILLRQLSEQGFHRVTLAVGHLAGIIQAYFRDGSDWGLDIAYAHEMTPLGTAGPLARLAHTDCSTLVLNGDLLTTLDFNTIVRHHSETGAAATIGTKRRIETVPFGVVESEADGRITQYREKPALDYLVSMGIYVFSPEVRDYIPQGEKFDFPDLVQSLLADNKLVVGYETTSYWMDIGRPDDYEKANIDFPAMERQFLKVHVESKAVGELEFDENELLGVLEAIDSKWITAGARTEAFENEFARLCGTSEAVAVCNGTAALFLALKSLGIGPGDEVLCPSLTFVATAAAVVHCGARPVLVDICSLQDPTIDPLDAEQKMTSRTKAILPVHYAGIPADMHAIARLAEAYGVAIVEDAAHAPGARFAGKACGSWGEAGCFSFFGNKNITTAEGGMITTSNPELARRMRSLRSHGMTVNSWDRDKGRPAEYDVTEFGFNFRLDDIRAALGLAQLTKLERINERRRTLSKLYTTILSTLEPDLILPFASIPDGRDPSFHIYPVLFPSHEERNEMEQLLRERGIQTSIHYKPIHRLSAFAEFDPNQSLPITEEFASRELTLPLYPGMMESHVDTIVSAMVQCRLRLVTS